MKTYNIKYKNYEELKLYIENINIIKYSSILVQVFSGIGKIEFIEKVIKNLIILIPKCKIIGTTSSGEIFNGNIFEKECLISISVFEKTEIKTVLIKNEISDFQKGIETGKKLIGKDTKVILTFADLNIHGGEFLEGINYVNNKVVIAGGIAGKCNYKDSTYVFTEEGIEQNAIVAAALDSKELYVKNASSSNCIPIGKEHKIMSVEKNIIKKIDNMSVREFYGNYLGTYDVKKIERIATKFPLMVKRNDEYISMYVLKFINDDEALVSYNLEQGEKVRIGYSNLREFLQIAKEMYEDVKDYPGESLFIYSCESRKNMFKKRGSKEIVPVDINISVGGYYTLGEFYHMNNKNMYFTETMTILMLSENSNSRIKMNTEFNKNYVYYNDEDYALYNLIRTTGEELEGINLILQEKIKEKTKELEKQYSIDKLTDLENRTKLIADLADKKYDKLAIIDIKSFDDINDFYGNIVGDAILISLSKLISSYCEKNTFSTYRTNSNRFAIVNNKSSKEEFIKKIVLLKKLITKECFFYEEIKIFITVTIGIAFEEPLLEKAGMALNYAKKNRKFFQIYKEELNISGEIKENIIWTKKIKEAIVENRIVPYFQPIFNNHLERIEKFEALIRMIDEDGKVISPYYFLDIAKKSGLYKELTMIMLRKVFEVLEKTEYQISINILFQDIIDSEIRATIMEKLKESKKSKNIIFEIVESEGIENFNKVIDFIKEIKKYGSKIAIDDFGTGYSNFNYLMKLNVDYIKIDGSIIKDINTDKSAEKVTKTIITFARELGIETVAEFVAEEKVFKKIKDLNIDYSQGYYFSEPKEKIEKI